MDDSAPSLLVTKLFAPRWREGQVPRSRLIATLDAGLSRKLVLVSAAAGSGKTTLVGEWLQAHAGRSCWLSLDERDTDSTRLLTYIIAALQTRAPGIGQEVLDHLHSPRAPAIEHLLSPLINQLAGLTEPLILVLDDYHVISNEQAHAVIRWLLAHLPAPLTLVLLTRMDPPLPLARMRANHEMVEVRAVDLRFSLEDTKQFLNGTMALSLSEEQVRALHERTEGWVAGLQLAALALQQPSTTETQFIRDFTGTHRHVLDYLMEEVLAGQPEEVRRFLLYSSPLRRFNAALCDAIMVSDEGTRLLEHLERCNMFLVPLDQRRRWYRYHHLFGDLLSTRLLATEPTLLPVLRRRAAEWHAEEGNDEEAIEYALAAGAFDYAAHLIEERLTTTLWRASVQTWKRWYRLFPPGFIEAYPHVAATFGQALAVYGWVDEASHLLRQVDPEKLPPYLALMVTFMNVEQRDREYLTAIAARARAWTLNQIDLLMLALLSGAAGDLGAACKAVREAYEESLRLGDEHTAWMTLIHLCRLHSLAGDLKQTHALCEMALAQAERAPKPHLEIIPLIFVALGRVRYEWNELEEAESLLRKALERAERTGFVMGVLPVAAMLLAEVLQAQGDEVAATSAAAQALEYSARLDLAGEVEWLRVYDIQIQLRQGRLTAPSTWLEQLRQLTPTRFYPTRLPRLVQAQVLLARREIDRAVAALTALSSEPPDLLAVEVWILLAMARQAQGDAHHARVALARAITLAEPERRVRVFLNYGAPLAPLLRHFCHEYPGHRFARDLLKQFPAGVLPSSLIEPLSEREQEILLRIAAGQSNREIASSLHVALSTVKWYINNLYGKLQVRSRTQAVARAREMGILEP